MGLRLLAVTVNAALFLAGLYFEAHARNRQEVWSAAAVAGVAVLNSAALTIGAGRGRARPFRLRLRRIAVIANTMLAAAALLIAVLEALRDPGQALVYGLGLAVPPLLTLGALPPEPEP
jgi:hypothetical protein